MAPGGPRQGLADGSGWKRSMWFGNQADGSLPPAPWQARFSRTGPTGTGTALSRLVWCGRVQNASRKTGTARGGVDSPAPKEDISWRAAGGPRAVAPCPSGHLPRDAGAKSRAEANTSLRMRSRRSTAQGRGSEQEAAPDDPAGQPQRRLTRRAHACTHAKGGSLSRGLLFRLIPRNYSPIRRGEESLRGADLTDSGGWRPVIWEGSSRTRTPPLPWDEPGGRRTLQTALISFPSTSRPGASHRFLSETWRPQGDALQMTLCSQRAGGRDPGPGTSGSPAVTFGKTLKTQARTCPQGWGLAWMIVLSQGDQRHPRRIPWRPAPQLRESSRRRHPSSRLGAQVRAGAGGRGPSGAAPERTPALTGGGSGTNTRPVWFQTLIYRALRKEGSFY